MTMKLYEVGNAMQALQEHGVLISDWKSIEACLDGILFRTEDGNGWKYFYKDKTVHKMGDWRKHRKEVK